MSIQTAPVDFGDHLRLWRQRRRLSQLDLAGEAEISTRHLSFIETGRSKPSRAMVLALAERLAVPLRERNAMLMAAGFAPAFPQRPLDDPDLAAARRAVDLVLAGHAPHPALAVDRAWTVVAMNGSVAALLDGVAPELLRPPVNALRLSLHPDGLSSRILNWRRWRDHLLARLRPQIEASGDSGLEALRAELAAYPAPPGLRHAPPERDAFAGLAVSLRLRTRRGDLSLISTTTIFGTPLDVTLSELAIESFFPADAETAAALARLAETGA